MGKYEEKLNELEKEAVKLHNEKVEILADYVKAIHEHDEPMKDICKDQWEKLYIKVKAINKQITLLKEAVQ